MIRVRQKGSFGKTENFLNRVAHINYLAILNRYGKEGVDALAAATPVDTGKTAASWYYEIVGTNGAYKIFWSNSNVVDGVPIAILIQYGHGTKNGGYVQGHDYLNPALKGIFERIANAAWKEVSNK